MNAKPALVRPLFASDLDAQAALWISRCCSSNAAAINQLNDGMYSEELRQLLGVAPRVLRLVKGLHGLRGKRDKAMLLVGFAAAFRRSELVSLDVSDLEFVAEGLVIRLRRSKTDQEGKGREIAIPYVGRRHCPCRALQAWLRDSGIEEGAIFRRIDKAEQVLRARLSAQAVGVVIKHRAEEAGLDPTLYSGHSLRAGFATSAAKAGAPAASIRSQTGHKSDAMLQRYIRHSELFSENANLVLW